MKRTLVLALLLCSCKPETTQLAAPSAPAPMAVHGEPGTAPASSAHGAAPAVTAEPSPDVQGTVEEVVPAGRYVYLRLKTSRGEEWAAVLATPVVVGSTVTLSTPFEKRDFDSPTLKRRFDKIWFGTLAGAAPAAAEPTVAHEVVAPPPGGMTITALRKDRATLAGKTVAIRGRVTKYNEAILGKNWLHVTDGSATDGSDDIVVTTTATSSVGTQVTVTGKVGIDRDLGSGYSYDVLIEEAEIKAE